MVGYELYVAATRFGLGFNGDELARLGSLSSKDWLRGQLASPRVFGSFSHLLSSQQHAVRLFQIKQEKQNGADKLEIRQAKQEELKQTFLSELRARVELAITTPTSFFERLVNFWSNHFTVSVKKGPVKALAGAFEREAIRPHVLGTFSEMLLAVTRHPAMLIYLDNAQSVGPDSLAGKKQDKGLNENLAREILELHTLGVNGGYTQRDVTTFAKVITGWGIAGPRSAVPGVFEFNARRHEPGAKTVLDREYREAGEEQGIRVLADLAGSSQTARHIATKLARHFIADEPPQEAVNRLASVYVSTGGQLPALYHALIDMAEPWDVLRHSKVKSSYDLVVSAARLAGPPDEKMINACLGGINFLGGTPFSADSPAGMPDMVRDLAGPEALIQRAEWAPSAVHRLGLQQDAMGLAEAVIGPVLTNGTRAAITQARSQQEGLALLLASPEFQRR